MKKVESEIGQVLAGLDASKVSGVNSILIGPISGAVSQIPFPTVFNDSIL